MAFSFGSNAPSNSLFGGNKAPAFGSSPAPAFGSGGFGASTSSAGFGAPASTTTNAFGAPAASTFGAPSSTPSLGGMTTPAPTPLQPIAQGPTIAGHMLYEELPKNYQQQIDSLYDTIRNHQRTMELMQTTGMATSNENESLQQLHDSIASVSHTLDVLQEETNVLYETAQQGTVQAVSNCQWALEAAAAHRGLAMTHRPTNTNKELQNKLQAALTSSLGLIDRLERMPPYVVWECIQDCEQRLSTVMNEFASLRHTQTVMRRPWTMHTASPFELHHWNVQSFSITVQKLHERMKLLKKSYESFETGENVLEREKIETLEREQKLQAKVKSRFLEAVASKTLKATSAPALGAAPATGFGSTAPAFGSAAPAPAFGAAPATGFGSTAPAPAFGAAPSTGFGSTAPTPAFGSTPPAPAFGAAPATGFGSTAPAPTFGAAPSTGFGSTAPTPAFGAAPSTGFGSTAPAPTFGSTAPAPAFGSSAPAPAFGSAAPTPAFGTTAPAPAFGTAPATGLSLGKK